MVELVMHEDSRYIRFFQWVWETDKNKLNICWLFWGTAFLPFGMFLKLIDNERFGRIYAWACGILSIVFFVKGYWAAGILFLLFLIIVETIFLISYVEENQAKGREIPEIAIKASIAADWVLDHTIGAFADGVDIVIEKSMTKRLLGFFSVPSEYFRALKERKCTKVRLVAAK